MTIHLSRTAIAVAFSIAFQPVFAAPVDDEAAIVVTATRFASDTANRPIAAQVITAEDIRDSSATTVSEVLNKLGGVHTRITFTGIPDAPLDLRGFGVSGDQNTLVLLNGQRISENEGVAARLSSIPIGSIERIEILRGSGAVLYGGGSTGGTINIITRRPSMSGTSGAVSATAGSHNLRDLRGSLQTGNDGWGLALDAQHRETDNHRANNRAEMESVSGELRFGGRDAFLALNVLADDQKARLPGVRTEAQLSSDPRGATTPGDFMNSRSTLFSLRGEKRFGDVTFALDLGQRDKTSSTFGTGTYDFLGTQTYTNQRDVSVNVTNLSPRLLWKSAVAGMDSRFTLGFDWSDWSYTNDSRNTDTLMGNSNTREIGNQRNHAFYFREEVTVPSTGTRFSFGARRENIKQDTEERITPFPERSAGHHLSAHELALRQAIGAGYSAYGRLGRSFRVANIDEIHCSIAPCPSLLLPQTSKDRELGMQWNGMSASYRIGLFEMDIENEIHFNRLSGPFGSNVNLSPTQRRGLEFEGKVPVGATVDLAMRYTRTQAKFREGAYGGVNVTGNDVPLVPKVRLGLNLGWLATATTRLTFNVNYVGSQRYDNDQANRFHTMPGYTVADIKVNHDAGNWRLAAGINNLFDKSFYSYAVVNGTYTSFNAYPEDRRNAYLSAEYRF